jgi:hypothetical protein
MPDTTRDMPLTVAKLTALMSATGTGLYLALGVQPSETAAFLLRVLPLLAVVLWLQRDAHRTGVGAVFDLGMFLLIAWWLIIPWYSFKTRGKAGVWVMMGLFALIFAPIVGAFATGVFLLPLQLLGS